MSPRRVVVGLVAAIGVAVFPSAGSAAEDANVSSENFTITYSTEPGDPNAPDLTDLDDDGVPDGVERVLREFEAARSFEIEVLGYLPPPNDSEYPLYIAEADGAGYTRYLPGGSGQSKPSYTVVPPDIAGRDLPTTRVATFAAHEYMHAIQNGYDAGEDHWMKEATAAWVEDVYLDDANPNHFMVRAFINSPREPLTSSSGIHEYGAFLFLQFLTERYAGGSVEGTGAVRELWESMAVSEAGGEGLSSLEAIGQWLAERGVSWEEAWREFVLWNRRLGHYEEGSAYRAALSPDGLPRPLRRTEVSTESCRLTSDDGSSRLPALSAEYVKVLPSRRVPNGSIATLAAIGPAGSTGAYVIRRRGAPVWEGFVTFDDSGVAAAEVPFDPATTRNVLVALANATPSGPSSTIAYSVRLPGASATSIDLGGSSITTFGEAVRLSGTVTCGGVEAPFARVQVTGIGVDGESSQDSTVTDSSGRFSLLSSPDERTTYSASLVDPLLSPAASRERVVSVRVRVTIEVAPQEVNRNRPVRVEGVVHPAHPGAPIVVEFRRPDRDWRAGTQTTVASDGSYAATLSLPAIGVWEIRARVAATNDTDHVVNHSGTRLVVVRSSG